MIVLRLRRPLGVMRHAPMASKCVFVLSEFWDGGAEKPRRRTHSQRKGKLMNRPLHITRDWVAVGSAVLALLAVIAVPTAAPAVTLPILHYSFDTGTTTGALNTTVLDRSPSGYNGTIRTAGGTPELSGAFNEALYFTGGSFVDVNRALLSTTDSYQPYTISFWMKAASGATGGLVTQYAAAAEDQRFGVGMWTADNGKAQWWSGGTGRTRTTMALDDGNWKHVVFVKNADRQVTVYVDGVNAADPALSNTHPFAFEATNTNIARFSSSTMPFTGYIDEVFIYDQAITEAQVQNLYAINRADPVSTLKIDFGSGDQVVQSGWEEITRSTSGTVTKVFSLDSQLVTVEMTNPNPGTGPHFNKRAGTIDHPIGDVMLDFAYGSFSSNHVMTFKDLDEGTYYLRTYHHDAATQYGPISIAVTDAQGSRQIGTGIPITRGTNLGVFSTVPMTLHADGTGDVIVTISPVPGGTTHISGLELTRTLPENLLVDMQFSGGATQSGFQPFTHPSASHSVPQELWFFSDLGVDGSVGVRYSTTSGTITPRNRANVNHELGDLVEDFMASGDDLTLRLTGIAEGDYWMTTYHHDVDANRGLISIDVLDATGFRPEVKTGLSQTSGTDPSEPRSTTFLFTADGTNPVDVTFRGDTIILNGFAIVPVPEPGTVTLLGIGLICLLGAGRRHRRR